MDSFLDWNRVCFYCQKSICYPSSCSQWGGKRIPWISWIWPSVLFPSKTARLWTRMLVLRHVFTGRRWVRLDLLIFFLFFGLTEKTGCFYWSTFQISLSVYSKHILGWRRITSLYCGWWSRSTSFITRVPSFAVSLSVFPT